jgi:hypothetical protein
MAGQPNAATTVQRPREFAEFLVKTPPETAEVVAHLAVNTGAWQISRPELLLHCEACEGMRWFDCGDYSLFPKENQWVNGFLVYVCRNCKGRVKKYALSVVIKGDGFGTAYKFGEVPVFGDPLPSRVFSLVGPDQDLFLQGRRAEIRGLGIGALTYYRRVVENQWERIVTEIKRVAEKLSSPPEIIKGLNDVAKHTQFGRAVDSVKPAVPQVLLIDGHNPLTMLHSALSEAIHGKSDQECLDVAQDIRIVLAELAERIGQALKDSTELKSAVSRLQSRLQKSIPKATVPATTARE